MILYNWGKTEVVFGYHTRTSVSLNKIKSPRGAEAEEVGGQALLLFGVWALHKYEISCSI